MSNKSGFFSIAKIFQENFKNEMESIKTFLLIVNSIAISNPGKGSGWYLLYSL